MSQILLFRIEEKTMGVEASYVRETVEVQKLILLPGITTIFSGLMNLRGRAIPVIHLSRLLGRSISHYELGLILEYENSILALPVAEVIGYQQYEGSVSGNDIFNVTEIAYEDIEVLSMPNLIKFLTTRLQFV